jgi:hypothetical protein
MKITQLITVIALCTGTAYAQDKTKPAASPEQTKEAAAAASEKEMEAWMAYMTPGEMHKMLATGVGEWNQEVTMWMDPTQPPTTSQATCMVSMLYGDRYQESVSKGDMMGMPFEGKATIAYDNAKKVFQSTWIDNMGTGIMYMEGPYDPKTKTITMTGTMVDPMTGKIEKVRETFKFIDDNNQFMEMFVTKNGKESKCMEIKFARKNL